MTAKKESFYEIIANSKPTLVDFTATWCGPCKMQSPILDQLAAKVKGKARIVKIDIDKNQEFASQLGVMSVPTLIIYKDSEIVWQQSGVQTLPKLEQALEKHYEN